MLMASELSELSSEKASLCLKLQHATSAGALCRHRDCVAGAGAA
jgi:hypothetical protein